MRIKGRLLLSYTAMLIIPIVLIAGTGAIFRAYYFGSERGWDRRRERIPIPHVDFGGESLVRELNLRTLENPDLLGETNFLRELENRLSSSIKGLAVRKGRDILYFSAALAGSHTLEGLPDFGAQPAAFREPGILRTRVNPLQWDFFFKDGSRGSLFVFWYGMDERFSWGSFIPPLVTILILILTNGFLTFIVSRSIMRPLATLKVAAERIKEGDLNSPVEYGARDEFGEVTTAFEQMRTRLKDSIEKQMQYEENRRELVSNISHDLRTPITAIKGYVEGIRDGVAGSPEKMEHYLETIYSRAVMLDRLIDELFLYSRLDLKRVPFNFEKVGLDGFLRSSFQELASDYEKLSVDYETAGMETMIVIADRVHLRRVLSNLIENSVKYNDKEWTSIRVRMEPAGESVSVSIHDNGPGIEERILPHIFERYIRGGSQEASHEGSGLGLAIARQIIEAHGGKIWAENNDGTVFHFTLKRAHS